MQDATVLRGQHESEVQRREEVRSVGIDLSITFGPLPFVSFQLVKSCNLIHSPSSLGRRRQSWRLG